MKKIMLLGIILLLVISVVFAAEDFSEAKSLIDQRAPCDELSSSQLELIGDYYMELMHPGELHELMDERMGGEGSESLRQVHISIARNWYCDDSNNNLRYGMMGYSRNGAGSGYGMMNQNYYQDGFSSVWYSVAMMIFWVLVLAALVLLIAWLIKQLLRGRK